ncbi:hypothetical protein AB0A70_05925 [Streptomyces morookaense]|uniref:hypothetical protein n=1 Tax=Streptomyces morookaense TaxID=1970 RepID=UPI0033D5D4CB
MSNGGTAVFVDVLTLAVSELADEPWHYRFASLIALQDQNLMGRGNVGFDLEDIDWGPSPQEQRDAKGFVLRVIDLALARHRWDELGYEPPYAAQYLKAFRAMVEAYDPATPACGLGRPFPAVEEAALASCVRHRVLTGLPFWDGCTFCHAESMNSRT